MTYIDHLAIHFSPGSNHEHPVIHSWRDDCRARLTWLYGDLAAWRNLGARK